MTRQELMRKAALAFPDATYKHAAMSWTWAEDDQVPPDFELFVARYDREACKMAYSHHVHGSSWEEVLSLARAERDEDEQEP